MRSIAASCAILVLAGPAHAAAVPALDHVAVVVLENHSYGQAAAMPYLRSLADSFVYFSDSRAVTHPSQPNYLAMWGGSTFGVTDDVCPAAGSPYMTENLGHACEALGVSWRAYSENLPWAGSDTCDTEGFLYARKHEPWTHFGNLTHLNERPFADLAVDIANDSLPRLVYIIPNQCNDGHSCPLSVTDVWLAANIPPLRAAVGPNGVVIVTWDEDDGSSGNRILTVVVGEPVKRSYVCVRHVTHYTMLRTICDAIGVAPFGVALAESSITDIWYEEFTGVRDRGSGALTLHSISTSPARGAWSAIVHVPSARPLRADVLDARGARVRRLQESPRVEGEVALAWDGRTARGARAASGVYVLRVTDGVRELRRSFVLLAR